MIMRILFGRPALMLVICILTMTGCTDVPSSTSDLQPSYAEHDLQDTPLGKLAVNLSADRPRNESGFLLLDRGRDALAWRLFMAERATRTIDAQYFLWKNDRCGRRLIQALLDAAQRGVRVRMLIDDSMTESDPQYLATVGTHPNIQVRLYKPFGPKHKSFVFRWVDFAADFRLLNRRMHNKVYIADDSAVIVGGRNIGEDYFEYLGPDEFRSRDLLGVGPITSEASRAFDMFWNSNWAVPISMAVDPAPAADAWQSAKQKLDEGGDDADNYPPGYHSIGEVAQAEELLQNGLLWGRSRLLYDTVPGENGEPQVPPDQDDRVGQKLHELAEESTQEIIAESAYLILTRQTLNHLQRLKERGVQARFLTNSLAANNHITAFVGYRGQRKQQIKVFTELYEYRPDAESQTDLYHQLAPGRPVPHLGLHAKTSVFDRRVVFVGSFNLDPRSENLNTEIGILVESAELGQAVANSMLNDMAPGNAWLVRLDGNGKTQWVTVRNEEESIEPDKEPLSSVERKLEADALQPITPESEM